ncbi:hypothetical protein [Terriglobus saanensis]|uniref:Uncharacterized protein n=1 Tax=Terriglobus saanensis (strain ATCC BAA-1853 / DSM 23119 / SP1PR4) TaxID=401053 RepID=E8UY18_TERSS|nr:hypothetical protein [Terriglobus saanensis]ADV84252.1 hypothetical protein AciPR4_3499 [Terriglobus saanensis SP1PR4]
MTTKKVSARTGSRYWLTYDLGIRGDYESLYEWLDQQHAVECGDSVATFVSRKSADEIKKELAAILGTEKRSRVYLISGRAHKGQFLIGGRKSAPWAGFALASQASGSDE